MHPYERLVITYFAALAVAAPFTNARRGRKRRAVLLSTFMVIGVIAASRILPADARAWLPHAYLVAGYWVPALLVPAISNPSFEAWLLRTDRAWRPYTLTVPAWAVHSVELSYLMCYVLVPSALAVVWSWGTEDQIDRFWLSVLISGYACYSTIPWLVSRPPRLLEAAAERARPAIASMNALLLAHVSHQLITFPSGHVAVATAAALAVFPVWQPGGVAMGVMAVSIAVGAAVGRYHFGIDVFFGAVIGIVAVLAASYF